MFVFTQEEELHYVYINASYLLSVTSSPWKDKEHLTLVFGKKVLALNHYESMCDDSDFFYTGKNTFTISLAKGEANKVIEKLFFDDEQ
ncbi:MAG: hypothetical protein F6K54_24360 [Okeania sp. SIO3B5]|uniref:hypothetical protein n=1 Tax=Okeania sp. SIO3B5 TaxID=2607811 RepID=UPI0014017C94|nr:hypothetical protein [Okeania sp. SIO3B5]NEO55924.1 hypothetical protein [Okeania sp. SIO3B5]